MQKAVSQLCERFVICNSATDSQPLHATRPAPRRRRPSRRRRRLSGPIQVAGCAPLAPPPRRHHPGAAVARAADNEPALGACRPGAGLRAGRAGGLLDPAVQRPERRIGIEVLPAPGRPAGAPEHRAVRPAPPCATRPSALIYQPLGAFCIGTAARSIRARKGPCGRGKRLPTHMHAQKPALPRTSAGVRSR